MDKRLEAVLSYINHAELLVDVGTDHGKIPIAARLRGLAKRVIATDISPACVQKAKENAARAEASGIDFVCTDGVQGIKEQADVIVIAGMGGHEIAQILSRLSYFPRLILVPHRNPEAVRAYLSGNSHIIADAVVECSGKYYPIIVAESGGFRYPSEDLAHGINKPRSADYSSMLLAMRGAIQKKAVVQTPAVLAKLAAIDAAIKRHA